MKTKFSLLNLLILVGISVLIVWALEAIGAPFWIRMVAAFVWGIVSPFKMIERV